VSADTDKTVQRFSGFRSGLVRSEDCECYLVRCQTAVRMQRKAFEQQRRGHAPMDTVLAGIQFSGVTFDVRRHRRSEVVTAQTLQQVAADACARPVEVSRGNEFEILAPLPDIVQDAGEETQHPRDFWKSSRAPSRSRAVSSRRG